MTSDPKRPGKETKFISNPDASTSAGRQRAGDMDKIETEFIASKDDKAVAKITIVAGSGIGETRTVYAGTNTIGRDSSSNRIGLDFGDEAISRKGHAILVCDPKTKAFRIFDGGKPNPVLLNGTTLSGDQSIGFGDVIQIGGTQMKLLKR